MSLIQLVKKAIAKDHSQYIQDLTRVTREHGDLRVYRAGRLMLHVCLATKQVLSFDIVGASETRASNSILQELHVPNTRFMYSKKETLLLTPNRVDNKHTWEAVLCSKA